jgi:hypothetical protein
VPNEWRLMVSQSNDRTAIAALCIVLGATLLSAQARPHYRTYRMGDDILAISRQLGVPISAASHAGSAVRELRWRADYVRRGREAADPVERLMFSFHHNQLFRIVIDYAPTRTDGMRAADVVAAVAKVYGSPAKRADPPAQVGLQPMRPIDTVVAQWNDDELHVALLQLDGRPAFRLIVASALLQPGARTAGNHETTADLNEWAAGESERTAPSDQTGAAREQARRVNIASFIP